MDVVGNLTSTNTISSVTDIETSIPVDKESDQNIVTTNNEINKFVVRMTVYPTVLMNRVRDKRYLKRIPQPAQPQHRQVHRSYTQQQVDEWTSIWKRLNDFMNHDTLLQQVRKESLIFYSFFFIICRVFWLPLVPGVDGYMVILATLVVTLLFVSGTGVIYVYHRNSDIHVPHGKKKAFIVKLLALTVVFFIAFQLVVMIKESDNMYKWKLLASSIPMFMLSLIVIVSCILFPYSCINRFNYVFDRSDKAIKKVYYEVKSINDDLIYFTLHPRVWCDQGKISVDGNMTEAIVGNDSKGSIHETQSSALIGMTNRKGMEKFPALVGSELTEPLLPSSN